MNKRQKKKLLKKKGLCEVKVTMAVFEYENRNGISYSKEVFDDSIKNLENLKKSYDELIRNSSARFITK